MPAEPGGTASGIPTSEPCIAIRDHSTMGRWFELSVLVDGRWHRAKVVHCDYGPAEWTGNTYVNGVHVPRAIDITGAADEELGFSQAGYPTEAPGIARELR